ncbi:MAG: 4-(cytidine 5'-diphospho)-2-C-methyl-D-erythritol kinase, partial [Proteobacteria bacterium]|nr:4-(cytidine 5'-diphospho)-2-C-methyl-D-erythritol kinase [Pseudomonadota bacterium]
MRGDNRLVVPAPGKVNLFLHVVGRRADGYHELETAMAFVDFADTIEIASRDDGRIVRTRALAGIAEDDDLALRAARALAQATGTRMGADIGVVKRIPQGGGLGGGSSDAASVLLALNRLWSLDVPRAELLALGATLGADVPVFIGGRAALARGIGERLAPLTLPPLWLVLARPATSVPTASVFAAAELTRSTPSAKIDVFSEGYGRNDLQPVVEARAPLVAEALTALA